MSPEVLPEPIAVAAELMEILDRLGIGSLVGGSLASSVHGEPRSTNDVDVLADLALESVDGFVAAIETDYYISADTAREAVRSGGSFNVIHLRTAMKVDVFVAGRDPFNQERLRCRTPIRVSVDPPVSLFMDTAEHSVLRKLEWFRRGNEQSERQWRDVIGVLRVQGEHIDQDRLNRWAVALRVSDLLQRARDQAV
jgi:hypothetical protein